MQHLNEDDMNLRKQRLEKPQSNISIVVNWWIVPGFVGIISTLFLGKFLLPLFLSFGNNERLGRSIDRIFQKLNEDVTALLTFDFAQTNIWMFILFGFIVGVVIKYVYSDEKI